MSEIPKTFWELAQSFRNADTDLLFAAEQLEILICEWEVATQRPVSMRDSMWSWKVFVSKHILGIPAKQETKS